MGEVIYYQTHKNRRFSDSSQYDEVCKDCGLTDGTYASKNMDNTPCTTLPELKSQEEIDLVVAASAEPPVAAVRMLLTCMVVVSAMMGWWELAVWFTVCVLMARKSVGYWIHG